MGGIIFIILSPSSLISVEHRLLDKRVKDPMAIIIMNLRI